MEENNTPVSSVQTVETPEKPMAASVTLPKRKLPLWIQKTISPLDGMHHIGLAFILPVFIMALIYVA
ncbi:MAG: hypothetical protein IJY93_00715, partial [Clostridia bacterium]|nr:hypothetical protein [Clostridia bacterium]